MTKNPFSIIPAKVLKDKRLTDKQLRLLCVLSTYLNESGYCFPSMARLADDCGCDKRTVIRNLKALVSFGYVCKHTTYSKAGGYSANLYYIHYEPEINENSKSDEVIRVIHNPSDTSVTTPSDTSDTTLVTPVSPKLYIENYISYSKNKNRACAQFANENEKEKLSEGDRRVFSDWYFALKNEIGDKQAEKAINALEIKKNKQKIMLIVPTLFLEGFLNELGFFDAYDKLDSVFADKGIELVKRAGIAGIDIKQQVMEG